MNVPSPPPTDASRSDRQHILGALVDWLAATNPEVDRDEIDGTTPLIEDRLVTSLQVTELLLFIERLRSAPIDVDELRPGVFHDFTTVIETFFPEARR